MNCSSSPTLRLGQVRLRLADIDVRVAVVAEDPKRAIEVQVDGGRLQILGSYGSMRTSRVERRADVAVRQHAHLACVPLPFSAYRLSTSRLGPRGPRSSGRRWRSGYRRSGRGRGAAPSPARPTRDDGTSVMPAARSSASIRSAAASAASSGTGRRVRALRRPVTSRSRSNSWRVPSRLTTTSRAASIRS